jgi:hypothetical protein
MNRVDTAWQPPLSQVRPHASNHSAIPVKALALAVAVLANCAFAILWPHPAMTVMGILLLLVGVGMMFSANAPAVVLVVPFFILHCSVMVSLVAIESGGLMKEMGIVGYSSTSGASYVIYSLIFLVSSTLTFARLQRRSVQSGWLHEQGDDRRPFILSLASLAIGFVATSYLIFAGLRTGFPLLTGTDRFAFRSAEADILTLNLLNLKFTIAAAIGVGGAFSATTLLRNLHHFLFSSYVAVSFLYGDKFFIILSSAAFYAMPFLLRNPMEIARAIRRLTPFALLAIISVAGVTTFVYSDYGSLGLEETLTKLGERVAGQGQLWFMVVEDSPSWLNLNTTIVKENLASVFSGSGTNYAFEHKLGPFHFVEKYMPSAMYLSFLRNGGWVTPTMVFEAYGLVTFGYLGLAFGMSLMGIVAGYAAHFLARSIMTGNPVNVLLPAYVMAQLVSFMAQAALSAAVSMGTLKACGAFLVLQIAFAVFVKRGAREPSPHRL